MKKTRGFLLTASIALATAITISCGSDGGGGGDGGNPGDNSTCSADFGFVTIGTQVWATKNLNCSTGNSKCYDNSEANCSTYGRLYDWATAKKACPSGWHLPSDTEWATLADYVGSSTAGTKLKATSGGNWNDENNISGNGTDEYSFKALPGGRYRYSRSDFSSVGISGYWWGSTEINASAAYLRRMSNDGANLRRDDGDKSDYYSVRCIKD